MSLESYQGQDVIVRRYIDSADVKDYVNTILIAKYFPRVPMNDLKVGELGLVSEYMANIVDDGSYGTALALNESFITRAILDESIYSAAATFDLGYEMAVPAMVDVTLQIEYDDIINYAVDRQVYIDKDTKILINGYAYVLDYDIRLTYTYIGGLIRFSAAYDTSVHNPVSKITTPYISCRVKGKFVTLEVTAREYSRVYQQEQITNNLVFTASPIDLPFSDMICGLTANYVYNGETQEMVNKPKYTQALNTPFLYHRMKDENTIQVSFASGKGKWRPEFNSMIDFTIYTTHGDEANFNITKDMECTVIRTGDRFIYNEDLRMIAYPHGSSQGGEDQPDIEMVRQETIKAFNTAHVLMTDDDISQQFELYAKRNNTVAKFFKRRDDPTGRLFGMFNIINKDNYIYETLTAKAVFKVGPSSMTMIEDGINGSVTDQVKEITLYSGDLWKYYDWTENELDQHTILTLMNGNIGKQHTIPENDYENVYVNPFIMKINRYPGLVSYYNPLINYNGMMHQDRFEENVLDHFQVSYIEMYRGIGENSYRVQIILVPSTQEDTYNEYDPNRNFKYTYPSNPNDTYYVSFSKENLNIDDVNTNNGEDMTLPDGSLNPNYKRSLVEYMKDTYGIYPSNGNTIYNTDVTEVQPDGFSGKYVYDSIRGYIRVTPDLFPLRVVLSAETTTETCYVEMVCVNEQNGTYTYQAELKTENDVGLVLGQEVLPILLDDKPYGIHAIPGKTPTAPKGTTYVMTTNTKLHIYTIYKPVNSDSIVIDPSKDKKMNFDAVNGTPPITSKVKMNPEIFDMRLNAIVHQIQSMNSMKQQGIIDNNFYVQNMDDKQKYRYRGEETPQWQVSTGTPTSDAYLFQFKFSAPPSITNADPVIFSRNITAAYACISFQDGTYSADIPDESTVICNETGSTYQYVKSTDRWLLLGSPSLFNDASFRGWNVTDSYLNDYEQFDLLEHWTQMRSTCIFNGDLEKGYRVDVGLVPFLRYDLCQDPNKVSFVIQTLVEQYKKVTQYVQDRLEENTGIDFKLYNTCGRGVFYKIGVNSAEHPNWTRMDKISIRIKFILGVREEVLYQDTEDAVKDHIKAYIENLDIDRANIFNVSNLQTSIENSISNVRYLIFLGINDYDSTYQRIKLDDPYKIDMTMYEYQIYVPEFLTINRDNITIIRGE